jgi:signal transduction histidine kinase
MITNAVKFTQKGEIRVSVEISEVLVEIKIKDTGVGMSESL